MTSITPIAARGRITARMMHAGFSNCQARGRLGRMTSPVFPEPPAPVPPTSREEADARVLRVAAKKDEWVKVPPAERIALLRQCIMGVLAVADAWVRDGCRAKGIAENDPLTGEEWIAGPWQTVRNARLLIDALEQGG